MMSELFNDDYYRIIIIIIIINTYFLNQLKMFLEIFSFQYDTSKGLVMSSFKKLRLSYVWNTHKKVLL